MDWGVYLKYLVPLQRNYNPPYPPPRFEGPCCLTPNDGIRSRGCDTVNGWHSMYNTSVYAVPTQQLHATAFPFLVVFMRPA